MDGGSLAGAVCTTIAYFDIFGCAVRPGEVHRFLIGRRATREEVEEALEASREVLGTRDGFWFLARKDHLAPRRARFLEHSSRLWPEARRAARLIERTGLASMALLTGSLAADNADEHADIDMLLVYPAARTWSSYAAVRLIAKLPGLGLGLLCPNYAVPDDRLHIRPENLFTAFEIAKAVPLFGFDVYERFARENAWVRRFLPNALPILDTLPEAAPAPAKASRVFESALFQRLEQAERRRKFSTDARDVGVDMGARLQQGSVDRHAPTRSFQTLSELRYRMDGLGLEAHPLYAEIADATRLLSTEMNVWGGRRALEAPTTARSGA